MRTWLVRILTRCLLVLRQLLSCCIGVHAGDGHSPAGRPHHPVESLLSQTTAGAARRRIEHSPPRCFLLLLRSVKSSNDPTSHAPDSLLSLG